MSAADVDWPSQSRRLDMETSSGEAGLGPRLLSRCPGELLKTDNNGKTDTSDDGGCGGLLRAPSQLIVPRATDLNFLVAVDGALTSTATTHQCSVRNAKPAWLGAIRRIPFHPKYRFPFSVLDRRVRLAR
jgi:hypothetical protein